YLKPSIWLGFIFLLLHYPIYLQKSTKLSTSTKLSVVIITYNEIEYIEECIDSVIFAHEIIVVDSYSNDVTWEYLQSRPEVKAQHNDSENFSNLKSYALTKTKYDWKYFFDDYERVTPKLQKEIIQTINDHYSFDAYWNYRSFMFKNQRLYFSGW